MTIICTDVSKLVDPNRIDEIGMLYGIKFESDFKEFIMKNNGGIPINSSVLINGKEYEIRCFMSFNKDEYNSIDLAIESFQKETKGKIYPIAKDSGDNYFCINRENGKVYFWNKDDNLYYRLTDSFQEFCAYLSKK